MRGFQPRSSEAGRGGYMGINNDVEQRRIEERPDWSLASACEGRTCIQNPKKNRYTERVFSMLPQIDFPDPLRYFRSVLGRGADPISSGACCPISFGRLRERGNCC